MLARRNNSRCPGSVTPLATRRGFLQQSSAGFGMLAFNGLFSQEAHASNHSRTSSSVSWTEA